MNNQKRKAAPLALLAVASLLLAGCTSAAGAGGHGSHGAGHGSSEGTSHSAPGSAPANAPSEASLMVCGGQVKGNLVKILKLDAEPSTSDNWANSTYDCTYQLADGDLAVSVQEASDQASALKYFDAMQALAVGATPIKGLASLGFPAYETPDGSVVFQKDSMILHVDASDLPAAFGPDKVTPTAFAYQVATIVLACWTEHT